MPETSEHLAHHIERRRKELRYSPTGLAEATGLSLQALKNIRQGQIRRYQERLTGPVTQALGWTPDSIDRLLAGEDPIDVDVTPPVGDGLADRVESLGRAHEQLRQLVESTIELWTQEQRTVVARLEDLERRAGEP